MAEPTDDLWGDDPLVRSLRANGTPGELADQDHYLAMFRESRGAGQVTHLTPGATRRPGARAARRFGAGTTLTIAIAVAGGGVAAAYTGSLPEPIQQFAHNVLGPVNVPPPTPRQPDRLETAPSPGDEPSVLDSPTPTPTPSAAQPTPTASPSKAAGDGPKQSPDASPSQEPSDSPSETPTQTPSEAPTATDTPTPTTTPTPTPTEQPTPTPTPTPTPSPSGPQPLRPDSLSISSLGHRVEYAASPTFSGVVRSEDGHALSDVPVALMQLEDGVWRRVAFATTDKEGAVSMSAPPIYQSTALRLRTKGAQSQRWRVSVHPELTLTSTVSGDTVTIVASTSGGQVGDVVGLAGRRDGQAVTLATGILGADGTVTFQVQQTTPKGRYSALLQASDQHTADKAVLVVVKPTLERAPRTAVSPGA